MSIHLSRMFARHSDILGREGLSRVIRHGIARAAANGITAESAVCKYTELMFLLGSGFDADPQLPWAGDVAGSRLFSDEFQKIDTLSRRAMRYFDATGGPQDGYTQAALCRVREPLGDQSSSDSSDAENDLLSVLQRVYPEKFAVLGHDLIHLLIDVGAFAAYSYGLTSDRGVAVYVQLMFVLGSSFDTDPLFHWASTVLSERSSSSEPETVRRLVLEALAFGERWAS